MLPHRPVTNKIVLPHFVHKPSCHEHRPATLATNKTALPQTLYMYNCISYAHTKTHNVEEVSLIIKKVIMGCSSTCQSWTLETVPYIMNSWTYLSDTSWRSSTITLRYQRWWDRQLSGDGQATTWAMKPFCIYHYHANIFHTTCTYIFSLNIHTAAADDDR